MSVHLSPRVNLTEFSDVRFRNRAEGSHRKEHAIREEEDRHKVKQTSYLTNEMNSSYLAALLSDEPRSRRTQ